MSLIPNSLIPKSLQLKLTERRHEEFVLFQAKVSIVSYRSVRFSPTAVLKCTKAGNRFDDFPFQP